jgi:sigma-B regulation protein RsbU (phosphoserine phosphatase)
MDDTRYEEHTYGPLRPGQVIVVGTDGVWEMPNAAGEQFGKARLREVIQGAARGTAEQVVQAVCDSLARFRGDTRAVDDVTFVVLKAVPVEAQAPPAPATIS